MLSLRVKHNGYYHEILYHGYYMKYGVNNDEFIMQTSSTEY